MITAAPTSLNLGSFHRQTPGIHHELARFPSDQGLHRDDHDGRRQGERDVARHAIGAQGSARPRRAVEGPESSHSLEKGAATIDVYGKGVPILLHRHSCAIAKFPRISPQQFDAVIVEPLGAFNDAQQISCMGQSIVALEVLSSEAGDNRSLTVIAHNFPVSHGRFPGRV
jgi:hypothetical protein